MKRIVGIGLVVAALALISANTAQASTSIGLNMTDNGFGGNYVTGSSAGYSTYSGTYPSIVTTPVYTQSNWNNLDAGAGGTFTVGNVSPYVYSDGSSVLSPLAVSFTSAGGAQDNGTDINDVAWGASTLGKTFVNGIGDGLTITDIPYAAYEVAVMVGFYENRISWDLFSGTGGTITRADHSFTGVISGSTFTLTGLDTSVAAVQILETSAAVPEPSTLLLLGLGGLSMIGVARRMRK